MKQVRESILEQRFPQFAMDFMKLQFPTGDYPQWTVNALASVNIQLPGSTVTEPVSNTDTLSTDPTNPQSNASQSPLRKRRCSAEESAS